jgi:dolichol-phosphate mannosyltransferase
MKPVPELTVIVPVYDEAEAIEPLTRRLYPVLDAAAPGTYEVVFVDDGSRDGSAERLDALARTRPRTLVLHLSRNFGQQVALQAGLDRAAGRAVVLMDADLQDPPELVPDLMGRWREGFDVVYAVRRGRKEGALKRAAYAIFYRTLRLIADIDTPLDAGDFCLLDRRVVAALVSVRERQRFLRGLRSWVGFRQTGVEYERPARHDGRPKYTVRKLVALASSGYVGFSTLPLRLATWLGFLCAAFGFAFAGYGIVARLTEANVPQGWASTIAVILFVGGLQLIILGVMGEYLGRVYDEVRQRPMYIVSSESGAAD